MRQRHMPHKMLIIQEWRKDDATGEFKWFQASKVTTNQGEAVWQAIQQREENGVMNMVWDVKNKRPILLPNIFSGFGAN